MKMIKLRVLVVFLLNVPLVSVVDLDLIECGVDNSMHVTQGNVDIKEYPFVGVLFYTYYGDIGETRAVSTVTLIHKEFVIGVAADIEPMPKHDFRKNTRVLLGARWNEKSRLVRNYIIHPEYGQTLNTVALVQLKEPVLYSEMRPACAPPERLRDPVFYVIKFKDDYNDLKKQVLPVSHVPSDLCREFYLAAHLYSEKLRPPHVACAVSLEDDWPCVWSAGAPLLVRDLWGRWQILGVSVRGPGCGAPSRYLDMGSYYPWIEHSLSQFRRLTITKLNKQKYVLRSSSSIMQRFGACDDEEKVNLVFRDLIRLESDITQFKFVSYNMTLRENIEYTCLTLELVNASAVSEMHVRHSCPRTPDRGRCHYYTGTVFDIAVSLIFADKCIFELFAWGFKKDMTLLDTQEWKWEEGTYYEDFSTNRHEYRGQTYMTEFGYEPLDDKMWVPEFDLWTTTGDPRWSSTTEVPFQDEHNPQNYYYQPTQGTPTTGAPTNRTKKTFRTKTTTISTSTTTTTTTTTTPTTTTTTKPTTTTTAITPCLDYVKCMCHRRSLMPTRCRFGDNNGVPRPCYEEEKYELVDS